MCIRDRYEDIPQNFVNCMVSIEDKKFYKHNGVDLKAIAVSYTHLDVYKRQGQCGASYHI